MSCEDRVPLGSQIKVSLGGKTELCVIPARHCGIGEMATGLAVPGPDKPNSPENRAVAHLEGSKSPPRPRTAEGPWLKVSQNAKAVPPDCVLQFPLTGPGVGGGVGGGVGVGVGVGVGFAVASDAVQVAVAPPLAPPQLHVHGPEPATDDAAPAEQRLAEGLDDTVVPFADPHTPLTAAAAGATVTVALAGAEVPPLPLQLKV